MSRVPSGGKRDSGEDAARAEERRQADMAKVLELRRKAEETMRRHAEEQRRRQQERERGK